jgi:lipase maturation factor 1
VSGPAVARLFHRLLALSFLAAWLSLGVQVRPLIGSRGLLPWDAFVKAARPQDLSFAELPTVFLVGASDALLVAGTAVGAALAVLALLGVAPRLSFALQTALYLGYAVACRTFLSFQWDNLLLECGLLAVFLPRDRPCRAAHFALRVLLFKLYFESGIAKWQSPLHDWQDGSAMTFYYETAPLPARLAHFAHALPEWWHHVESWFTLFFELAVPFAIFGPRRPRLAAAAIFTGFQAVNFATANYGFFTTLAVGLHVMLLEDRDLLRARGRIERRLPWVRRLRARARWAAARRRALVDRFVSPPWRARLAKLRARMRSAGIAAAGVYTGLSLLEGCAHFGGLPDLVASATPLRQLYEPFRMINTYHLFAAITRERIEPELQVDDGTGFRPLDLRYKAGDPQLAPGYVAPHQPRLDFQLWFYGLSFQRGSPPYVTALVDRLCHDREAVQSFFAAPLPAYPVAVRIAFWRYHFTTPAEKSATGAWWKREWVGSTKTVACR